MFYPLIFARVELLILEVCLAFVIIGFVYGKTYTLIVSEPYVACVVGSCIHSP